MGGGETTYLKFGWESTFATASTTITKSFGEDPVVKNLDLKNNVRRLFRLNNRNAVAFVASKFEGALGIDFDLSDPWFLKGVLGAVADSGTQAPWTHTYSEANLPPSMTIENGIDLTNDAVRKYLGAIIADCRISCPVGEEPTKVSLTVLYANESKTTSGLGTQGAPVDAVYPFSMASFEYPTGTAIADMENVNISIANSASLKWALGSRIASRYTMRQRTYDVSCVNYFDNAVTYLEKFYGGTTQPQTVTLNEDAGCKLTLSNGLTGSTARSVTVTLTGAIIDHHGLPQSVQEELMESVDIFARSATIAVVNGTSTEP